VGIDRLASVYYRWLVLLSLRFAYIYYYFVTIGQMCWGYLRRKPHHVILPRMPELRYSPLRRSRRKSMCARRRDVQR